MLASAVPGLLVVLIATAEAIKWLAIHNLPEPWTDAGQCPLNRTERKQYGMVTHQARMCRRMPELMPVLISAAQQTVDVCQGVFADRRWNCSTIQLAPELKQDLTKGTKEQAYVYALSAAAVTHQVAKACVTGHIPYCPCGYAETTVAAGVEQAPEAYKWKGCSDNVAYGKRVSREWADALWRRQTSYRRRKSVIEFDEEHLNEEPMALPKSGPKARMNQHNNDVGRLVTQQSLYVKCKCHGVSSGCDIQTCWHTLPSLNVIADKLKERYNEAYQLGQMDPTGSRSDSRMPRVSSSMAELLYSRPSPTYCDEDLELGSYGTRGRECNNTLSGPGNCESMCCGRGFNTQQLLVEEQCHCKYVHCCYIKCKKCTSTVDKHYCK